MTKPSVSLFVERGPGERIALYIDGDLQFDSTDERQYHELLVHPALALAGRSGRLDHVLVLGSGDGLALREVLRHDVGEVDLVDYDADVVALGRRDFRALNCGAFEDPRVRTHTRDARAFVDGSGVRQRYNAVICDLTVPRSSADCALYSIEWFSALRAIVAAGGLLATNATSPVQSPQAFWSVHNAIRAAGFEVRPLHFALPSFSREGYGEWGFLIAGAAPLGDLSSLRLPLGTSVDAAALQAALRFPRSVVAQQATAAAETARSPVLFQYLLNAADGALLVEPDGALVDFARPVALPDAALAPSAAGALARSLAACLPVRDDQPIDIDRLVDQLPLQHRYQTRQMLRELSTDWASYVRSLDLAALIHAILARVRDLPARIRDELQDLRDRLRDGVVDAEHLLAWGGRVATVLIIVIILANTLMPDSAFAKGPAGGGPHVSAGQSATQGNPAGLSHLVSDPSAPATAGRLTDYFGNYYPRGSYYYRPYYRRSPSSPQPSPGPSPQPTQGQTADSQLVAGAYHVSPDATLLENGGVVVSLDQERYLTIAADALLLMRQGLTEPVYALYRSPALVAALSRQLGDQVEGIRNYASDLQMRRAGIGLYTRSASRLDALAQQLERSRLQLGASGTDVPIPSAGAREIFASAWTLPTGVVALHGADGGLSYLSGDRLYPTQQDVNSNTPTGPAPADLRAAVRSVLTELVNADSAELAAVDAEIRRLGTEVTNARRDLAIYLADQQDEGSSDIVEYGTDRIPVRDAIARTESDVGLIQRDLDRLFEEQRPLSRELEDFQRALRTVQ